MSIIAQSPQTKTCTKCNIEKPLEDFPLAKRYKYGRNSRCRKCRREYERNYAKTPSGRAAAKRYNQSELRKAVQRKYERSEKGKAKQNRYRQTANGKARTKLFRQTESYKEAQRRYWKSEKSRVVSARWRKANPEKILAKNTVTNAVQRGELPNIHTLACTRCGSQAKNYHHWSYEPQHHLDVIPVCKMCHVAIHGKPNIVTNIISNAVNQPEAIA